ncbi:uncharacterized protein LOC134539400 [Bacillus rossius redtenbacheri]|uniref:uncharacterized protein LOC134539400 n=1 Tax=Bacillus rossius redtenbacheri TaxID=93214 RepID=UPI002FDDAF89
MSPPRALLLCLHWILREASCLSQAAGPRLLPRTNTVLGVNSSCDADTLWARVRLQQGFSGLLYARGFPLACRALGTGDLWAGLALPGAGCGVKVLTAEDGSTAYSVVLKVQLDRRLQQATDQEVTVTCQLPETRATPGLRPAARTGRKQVSWAEDERSPKVVDGAPKAWLDISGSRGHSYVSVGEQTRLRISALLPAGSGLRVVDCAAHDGAGEGSQRLLDDEGCPLDETLLPALSVSSAPSRRLYLAQAVFPAFKFPDRDSLHLRCTLHVCRGACPQAQCDEGTDPGTAKLQVHSGEEGEVLQRLDVFNSVQVLAPGIETYDTSSLDSEQESEPLPHRDADRSVCLSPPKMVLVLSLLVLVFLGGVAMVLWTLLLGRRPPGRRWFHHQDSLLVLDSPQLSHRPHWRVLR